MPIDETSEWELVLRENLATDSRHDPVSTHHLQRKTGYQVFKRANGVEVVYRNEITMEYSATTYPWWRVVKLSYYGTLTRREG